MYGLDQTSEWHHKDIFFHTMEVVDNAAKLSKKVNLRLAALVHDIGKPKTRRIHKEKGYTFCMIEHDIDFISRMCDPVIVMCEWSVLFEGNCEEVKKNEKVIDSYLGRANKKNKDPI